ncbi:MAG: phosphoadenylyl-sulfate reductase [Acidimicrobiales bacterium]
MARQRTTDDERLDHAGLEAICERLEGLPPLDAATGAISWTTGRFGREVAVASSFQDLVLIDLARRQAGDIEVLFLDTGFHFAETLAFVDHVRKTWDLNLTVTHPDVGPTEATCGSTGCCQVRKVEPLARALTGKKAWLTGLKRVDTPERAGARVVAFDAERSIVKVNPLAAWSDDDIEDYVSEHCLPRHPLTYVGYVSIGCEPTTKPVTDGQHPREGRWPGSDKTECGLHL